MRYLLPTLKFATAFTVMATLFAINAYLILYGLGLLISVESWPGFIGKILEVGRRTDDLVLLCVFMTVVNIVWNLLPVFYLMYLKRDAAWKRFRRSLRWTTFLALNLGFAAPLYTILDRIEQPARLSRNTFADVEKWEGPLVRACAEVLYFFQEKYPYGGPIAIVILALSVLILNASEQVCRLFSHRLRQYWRRFRDCRQGNPGNALNH